MNKPTCLTCGRPVVLTYALYCKFCCASSGLTVTSDADVRRRNAERRQRQRQAKKVAA